MKRRFFNICFVLLSISLAKTGMAAYPTLDEWTGNDLRVTNADALMPAVLDYEKRANPQKSLDNVLAVRIAGPWEPWEKDRSGRPINYSLPVHVAVLAKNKPGYAYVATKEFISAGDSPRLPFANFNVTDGYYIALDKLPSGSLGDSSGSSSMLSRLLLVAALLGSGLLLVGPLLQSKLPQLKPLYDVLTPIKPVVGVASLALAMLHLFAGGALFI